MLFGESYAWKIEPHKKNNKKTTHKTICSVTIMPTLLADNELCIQMEDRKWHMNGGR